MQAGETMRQKSCHIMVPLNCPGNVIYFGCSRCQVCGVGCGSNRVLLAAMSGLHEMCRDYTGS